MTLAQKNSQAENALTERLTPEDVAARFGISASSVTQALGSRPFPDLRYRTITGVERDAIMLGILQRMQSGNLRVVGGNDNTVWERGWGEILEQVESKGFHPSLLRPQYFDHHRIMRLNGEYIDGGDASFVYEYDQLLRRITLTRYLKDADNVVELGAGTGTSQLILAELLPNAKLTAADWAKPSQGIIRGAAKYLKRDITPVCFNMLTLEGWDELNITQDSVVLTVHALEQLGANGQPLLDKLLAAKPRYCLHLEPVVELYDETKLFDHLAIQYHLQRNYLQNWLTPLRELAKAGKVEIMEERRLAFGDRYHEAYSVIQWKAL